VSYVLFVTSSDGPDQRRLVPPSQRTAKENKAMQVQLGVSLERRCTCAEPRSKIIDGTVKYDPYLGVIDLFCRRTERRTLSR
jgi:hypothetical protein